MALFNYATKEITLKIVYYGPGLSGKTTNLQHLHTVLNPETKGKLLSLSTESDRTLFFDFLPVELGKIRDFSIRFQLYTVPGQVRYNATRKVVLKGADAVVFVADSQEDMRDQNIESFENMRENLISNNINPDTIPVILQYNKRDLDNILSVEALNQDLNQDDSREVLEAVAVQGKGVEETFKKITKLLLKDISRKHKIEIQTSEDKREAAVPIKPAPEPRPLPSRQDIFPETPLDEIRIPEPKTLPAAAFEIPTPVLAMEDAGAEPEYEIEEAELIETEPLTAAPADVDSEDILSIPEPVDVGTSPEYEIEEAELAEEAEPLETFAIPEPSTETTEVIPEFTEKGITNEPRNIVEQPGTVLVPELADTVRNVTAQPFLGDEIGDMSVRISELSLQVSGISEAVDVLRQTLADLKGEVRGLREHVATAHGQGEQEPAFKDSKEFKELKRNQKEISDLLRDVVEMLNSLKEKRSWFRL
ncbi:MAG: GTPase domain-containing protein [Nitrospirae bacterium]|nr:GTPase domain-containing protein [Nitrospirota bacterium]